MTTPQATKGVAQSRYEALERHRDPVLRRARQASALTIPHLIVPEGFTEQTELPTPYQSIGARGVRNLASKLLLTQFPPNQPFFKYDIDDFAVAELNARVGEEGRGEIEKALNRRERAIMKEADAAYLRTAAFEVFRHLLVAGNVLLYVPDDGPAQVFKLDQYVVKRDPAGNVLEIVLKQSFAASSLEDDVLELVKASKGDFGHEDPVIDVFTYVKKSSKNKYKVFQETCGKEIPGTSGTFTEDTLPYRALRLTKIDGSDYGRGYIEEYLGDLISLEGLSQTLVEGSAAVSKVIFLVSPNGNTDIATITRAENGAVVNGSAEDITVIQAEKRADFSVVQAQIQALEQRLAFAFLLNTAIQRQGERVTAEEIRYMAQELEDGLGGMYTLLAQELQLPLVKLFEARMEKRRRVPKLPKGFASPTIITGIDALGRGQDLRNLDAFLVGLGETFGPDVLGQYIKLAEAIKRRGAALGIDMDGLVRTDDEIAQAEQQAQLLALAQHLGPNAINAFSQLTGKQMELAADTQNSNQ